MIEWRYSIYAIIGYFLTITNCWAVSIGEVFQSVMLHHPEVIASKYNIDAAKAQLMIAKGEFDPAVQHYSERTPTGGYENRYNQTRLSSPLGYYPLNLYSEYRNGQGDWPSYNRNFLTNSSGEVSFGAELPLIRDLMIDARRSNLLTRKLEIELTKYQAQRENMVTLSAAGNAYWSFILEGNKIVILEKLLKLAQARQAALDRRHYLGDTSKIELVENTRLILKRQEQLVTQRFAFEKARQTLSLYYRDQYANPLVLTASDLPQKSILFEKKPLSLSVEQVLSANPEINSVEKLHKITKIKLMLAKNDLKPYLNINISAKNQYGKNGDPLLREPSYTAGLTFDMPILQRRAKGEIRAAKINLMKLDLKRNLITQKLMVMLNNLNNRQKTGSEVIQILSAELEAAKAVENAERIRFEEGDSSIFLVNQREQTSFSVEIELLSANVDYCLTQMNLKILSNLSST